MKNNALVYISIISLVAILFLSCSKDKNSYQGPTFPVYQQPTDNLAGREFIFDSLIWQTNDFGSVWIHAGQRPDLFSNPNRAVEVFIKLDSLPAWIPVLMNGSTSNPPSDSYLYAISPVNIVIIPNRSGLMLIDRRAALKVKFL